MQVIQRFRSFTGEDPWSWTVGDVDEFFMELRAVRSPSHSTLLAYQNALRLFLGYLDRPGLRMGPGMHGSVRHPPVQVCHEWNTATHVQEASSRARKRPLTRDELQDLFDYANDLVDHARKLGRKGWISAFRTATAIKVQDKPALDRSPLPS